VDRMASATNTQLVRFNVAVGMEGAEAVDCFGEDWAGEVNWVCPPFHLVGRVLAHMRACRCRGTILVPEWQGMPWWPVLFPAGEEGGVGGGGVVAVRAFAPRQQLFDPGVDGAERMPSSRRGYRVLAVHVDFGREPPQISGGASARG
jgi:hypothetical protein